MVALGSAFGDDVYGMNDPRNVPQNGQKNVQPEMLAQSNLQEHAKRREQDRDDNSKDIQSSGLALVVTPHKQG